MSGISVIIVDDEKQAREGTALLLQKDASFRILAICKDGLEAIESVNRLQPDLLLLDIQMPEINGFEVLNSLTGDNLPFVIFITAYDQFALKAFELHAIDYLLKPFTDERFFHALQYAKRLIQQKSADQLRGQLARLMEHYLGHSAPSAEAQLIQDYHQNQIIHANRLAIKSSGKIHFVPIEDIYYLEGYDAYIKIHTTQKMYLVKDRLKTMADKLPQPHFIRIHKSYIVNTTLIQTLEPHFNGDFFVHLSTGQKLKGSRTYRKLIEANLLK